MIKQSEYKRADDALTKMLDADKKLKSALAAKGDERLAKGLQFVAAAEQVDTEALGGVIDYKQPTELIELLRELKGPVMLRQNDLKKRSTTGGSANYSSAAGHHMSYTKSDRAGNVCVRLPDGEFHVLGDDHAATASEAKRLVVEFINQQGR